MMLRNLVYLLLIVLPLCLCKPDTIIDIISNDHRFKILVQHLERHDLMKEFKHRSVSTLFAPVNEAFERRDEDATSYYLMGRKVTREQLLYHILPVALTSDDLYDGQLLQTKLSSEHNVSQQLKVRKGDGLYVGDVEIIERDLLANDGGVVHTLKNILTPPVDLASTLSDDRDLLEFSRLVEKVDLTRDIKEAKGYTLFVSKDVLGDLDTVKKNYLMHECGKHDLSQLLKHQIHDKIVYAQDFPDGRTNYKTLQGEDLQVVVNKDGKITVNDVNIVRTDILASNGVIHFLEKPILPKNKDFLNFGVRKTLIGMNATKFTSLFDEHGLGSYLDEIDHDKEYTIVAPPNEALDESLIPLNEIPSWLKYHIIQGRYAPSDLIDGALLKTESGDHLSEANQRIRVHVTNQDHFLDKVGMVKQSIQFGRAGTAGEPVSTNRSIIYPVARALVMPRDPLSRLPVNLDLSTFVASLYASNSGDDVKMAKGITIFAPTNEAFGRLGLLTKHLLQPESQSKLESVVKFHVVRQLYYSNETEDGEHREETLAGPEINLNKTEHGFFVRGSGAADGSDRTVIAQVTEADILVNNGVIHKIDRVQLPGTLEVSNRDMLSAEGANSILGLLERTELGNQVLDQINGKPYTILAPSDRAFAKVNFTHLLQNPDKLLDIARLHIIPMAIPRLDLVINNGVLDMAMDEGDRNLHKDITVDGVEFPTLKEGTNVVIRKGVTGGYSAYIKNTIKESADVVNVGRASNGGGVIILDKVLLPQYDEDHYGLPWWKVLLIVIGVLLGVALLAAAGYYAWQWYQRRREGQVSI